MSKVQVIYNELKEANLLSSLRSRVIFNEQQGNGLGFAHSSLKKDSDVYKNIFSKYKWDFTHFYRLIAKYLLSKKAFEIVTSDVKRIKELMALSNIAFRYKSSLMLPDSNEFVKWYIKRLTALEHNPVKEVRKPKETIDSYLNKLLTQKMEENERLNKELEAIKIVKELMES